MKRSKRILDPNFKKIMDKIITELKVSLHDLHEAATRDQKTGLHNYEFFKNVLSMELDKAKRGMQSLCVIAIDIDFFKKINDTYGHIIGDKILIDLGRVLGETVRKYDVVSRFGGEEFFILLPQTKVARAKLVAERLRKKTQAAPMLKKFGVTISLGVTEFKEKDSFTKIMRRCDKALYTAKKRGRNQVVTI